MPERMVEMVDIEKKASKDYIDDPWHCPFCGDTNIQFFNTMRMEKQLMSNKKYVTQSMECNACDKQWSEYYTMKYVWSGI